MSLMDVKSNNGSALFSRVYSYASSLSGERVQFEEAIAQNANRGKQMAKLLLVMAVPVIALLSFTANTLVQVAATFNMAFRSAETVQNNLNLAILVGNLQKERGLSAMYLSASDSNSAVFGILQDTRTETDRLLSTVTIWPELTVHANKTIPSTFSFLTHIGIMRRLVDIRSATAIDSIRFYTENNLALIKWIMKSCKVEGFGELQKLQVAQSALLQGSDSVGIMRALGSTFFSGCELPVSNLQWFNHLDGEGLAMIDTATTYDTELFNTLKLSLQQNADAMTNLSTMKTMMIFDANFTAKCNQMSLSQRTERSLSWFSTITKYIDILFDARNSLSQRTQVLLNDIISSSRREMIIYSCLSVIIICTCIALSIWYASRVYSMTKSAQSYTRRVNIKKRELAMEKKRSENLLYRMIPQQVAEQLRLKQEVKAEEFESVTIYFSDIMGFTEIGSQSSPMQVVDLLNTLYRICDECIDRYDVYKVETIGDAYMVVSGLPTRNGTRHCAEIADMSSDILHATCDMTVPHLPEVKIKVRIGLHSGPCVAGVVGNKMPRYCLFGDTVNTASRMESTGEAEKIHVSQATQELLIKVGEFDITARGEIAVKGKGMMNTYWLHGRKRKPGSQLRGNSAIARFTDESMPEVILSQH